MCIPDITGDGESDTCLVCLPLMGLLCYCCCCKDVCDKNGNQSQPSGYVVPGGGYAPPGGGYPQPGGGFHPQGGYAPPGGGYPQGGYGYPAGPGQFPSQPGYYPQPNQPSFQYGGAQPGYPPQPGYYQPQHFTQNYGQNAGNGMKSQPQPGSTIVSYVQ